MTRVKVTYIAIDDEGAPIASAETQEHLKEALDIYYGVEKGAAKCEGWFPFQTEYPDDYEGYYEYSWRMVLRDMIEESKDMVKVYCVNFHPHTEYDIKEAQKKLITEIMNEDTKDRLYKQTAVELLMKSILGKDFRLTCSDEQLNAYQQAKQMESEQTISKMETIRENGIVELSDKEIEEMLFHHSNEYAYGFKDAIKWYREQLKQRQ